MKTKLQSPLTSIILSMLILLFIGTANTFADDDRWDMPEENAEFPGGDQALLQWIQKNIKYPQEAADLGIQGRVLVSFIIETDSTISEVKVIKTPDPSLSDEAVRLVQSMPKWKPARLNNKPVRSRYVIPIIFKLNEDKFNYVAVNNITIEPEDTDNDEDKIYDIVEEPAEFPGGAEALMNWFAKNLRYPAKAQEYGIQGTVKVSFVINRDGYISDAKVHFTPDESLSKEALRLVNAMPRWKPARQGHKQVNSRFVMPVKFKL